MSWASMVKKNITPALGSTPTDSREPEPPCDDFHKELFHREIGVNQESLVKIEKEDEVQCRPTWVMLKRPDAPKITPVFKTREELHDWEYSELLKNQNYSDEAFEQRTQEWRIKNNWLLPPMKTKVSKDEQTRGFYVEHDHTHTPIVFYVTPFSTEPDLALTQTRKSMIDMLWCLVHSRSDELVACKTVAEFKALFERNIRLEPELRHVHLYNRNRKHSFPLKMLWLLSQKANVFPGKARHGTARWTKDPVRPPSNDYCNCMWPVFDPKIYSKSMIFFSSRKFRDSNNAIIQGQHGGREETGICVVERLKENGDAAPIRWLLSAKQLREMERVSFHPECSPFRESVDYDSDCYGYDDDWL